jgi:hypothetical protein
MDINIIGTTGSDDCSIQLRSSHTEVRLLELITDLKAVKILLEAVRATTLGGNLDRLGNVPMDRDVMLNAIETASPHIGEIASANPGTLLEGIKTCGPHMESLLSWALSAYLDYLLSLLTVGLEAYGGLLGAFMLLGTAPDRENVYVYLFIHVIFCQFFDWWLRLRGLKMAGLFSSFCKLFLL